MKTPLRNLADRRERPSRRRPSGFIVRSGLPVLQFTAALLCGCDRPAAPVPPPPIVEVMAITPSEVPLSTMFMGQIDSPQNVDVRARVEAFVDEMKFVEGTEVKKGDVLFVLDKKPFLEKLSAAKGAMAEAQAALGKYRTDVDRLAPLARNKAVPQQDLDNAKANVDVANANVITAQSRVETAQLNLGYCEVLAPVTGLIGATQVAIGDLVGKGDPTLLATISTLDPIWFYCNISEVQYIDSTAKLDKLGKAAKDVSLTLLMANGQAHPDQGKIVFIDRAVDSKTGTMRIRGEFPNRQMLLRPGMFARVRLNLGTRKDCLEVPERAVVELQGKSFLWVVDKDGKASQRQVKIGEQNGSKLLVLDGLKPGERIIVEGIQKAREGAPVTAMTAAQIAALHAATAAAAQPETK